MAPPAWTMSLMSVTMSRRLLDVVGLVDLAEDLFDPLPLLLEPDVLGLDGDPLLELLDEVLVDEALDLLDLGVDVPDLGFVEVERLS